jgi:hypothetical protein
VAGFAGAESPMPVYIIRLLYQPKPVLDKPVLLREMQAIDSAIQPLDDTGILMFVKENHRMHGIAGGPWITSAYL